MRAAKELQTHLRYIQGRSGTALSSLLRLNGDTLHLSCLKRAEDSDDVIVRLYEPHGDCGHAVLQSSLDLQRAAIVNLLEEELEELPIKDPRRLSVSFTPFQVVSLRISLAGVEQ